MNINTKYEVGDTAYYIENNKICSFHINRIQACATRIRKYVLYFRYLNESKDELVLFKTEKLAQKKLKINR